MVFQNFALYPHLSVFGNMAFGLKLRRLDRAKIESRVGEAAELLGIADLLARRPGELSGGQQQRVALGKAIVRKPKLVLFDEPLSNLDAPLRAKLRQEIRRLHQRLDATMLYVTHDQTEAMTLGRRIALMHEGRILQVAEPRQLYNRPANRHVAEMIGSPAMNLIDGRIRRAADGLIFDAKSFNIPLPREFDKQLGPYVDRPIVLGIRPEHVTPQAGTPGVESTIEAIVEAIEPLGAETYIDLLVGQHAMTSRVAADHGLCSGQRVLLILTTEKLHFFDPPSGRSLRQ
jgi:multiple sugar transport system ATP-binding protein